MKTILISILLLVSCLVVHASEPLAKWTPQPADWTGANVQESSATLSGEKWSYLYPPNEQANTEVTAVFTITEPAKLFRFFGQSWSVWPDQSFGDGSFDWKQQGFVFEVPEGCGALSVAFGNAGTGEMLVTDVEFRRLNEGEALPAGVSGAPSDKAPDFGESIPGAIADFRLEEGSGNVVFNHAGGPHLDLANLDWVIDSGRPALRFADTSPERRDFRKDRYIGLNIFGYARDFNYLKAYKSYEGREATPFAMSLNGALVLGAERYYLHSNYYRGLIGRTLVVQRALSPAEIAALAADKTPQNAANSTSAETGELTLAAWIKPAGAMNPARGNGGDIMGYGNRKLILTLKGSPPYSLLGRVNESRSTLESGKQVAADRWTHVALTTRPNGNQQTVRLYIDGQQVAEDEAAGSSK